MDEQAARAQRTWDYHAFIDELKPLIEEVKSFGTKDRDSQSDRFKVWRHRVSSLCHRIDRTHVDSSCGVDHRQFRILSMYGRISPSDQRHAFERDLRDTITELEHIVDQYSKFGEPEMKRAAAAPEMKAATAAQVENSIEAAQPAEEEWPSQVTMDWLWRKMPATAWWSVIGLVFVSFTAGTAVGAWPVLQKWVEPAPVLTTPTKVTKP